MSSEERGELPVAAQYEIGRCSWKICESFLEKLTCRCVKPTGTHWLFFWHPPQLFQRTAENSSGMFYCKRFKLPLLEIALVLDCPVCQKNRRDCKKSSCLLLIKQYAFTHVFLSHFKKYVTVICFSL